MILVANKTACKIFGYKEEQLCGMKIYTLFTMEDGVKQESLLEQHIDTDGKVVMLSGKVVSEKMLLYPIRLDDYMVPY